MSHNDQYIYAVRADSTLTDEPDVYIEGEYVLSTRRTFTLEEVTERVKGVSPERQPIIIHCSNPVVSNLAAPETTEQEDDVDEMIAIYRKLHHHLKNTCAALVDHTTSIKEETLVALAKIIFEASRNAEDTELELDAEMVKDFLINGNF